jgi:hypothetical protein
MLLTISGLDAAPIRFRHLWGRYVLGFRPWKHCIGCFESKVAGVINPSMIDGDYKLKDDVSYFYLCGVGQAETLRAGKEMSRKVTNVHLAVRPRLGSVAAIGSVYGVTFTIQNAHAIPIQPLPEGFMGLPTTHHRCKNFQFGYQIFDVGEKELAGRNVIRKLRQEV